MKAVQKDQDGVKKGKSFSISEITHPDSNDQGDKQDNQQPAEPHDQE